MRDLLLILNPRRIEECLQAFRKLPIDRLWVRGMTEYEIQLAWPDILETAADYQRVIAQSDDGIVRPHALAEVIRLLDAGHPVVTGYSNLSAEDFRVNLTKKPPHPVPAEDSYDLYHLKEVMEYPTPEVPTYFAGMCLTGMSHAFWQRFPFLTYWNEHPGSASDLMLSTRLNEAGIPIVAAREAFVWHVKERWNLADREERKQLYLHEPSEIVLEAA